jgi:hypothetical protein
VILLVLVITYLSKILPPFDVSVVYISGVNLHFSFKVGVDESIVNASLVILQSKNTNNAKVRLDLNS